MFLQLGNIIFKGLLSPNSFSAEGDEATYAEYALIGGKPRMAKTGDELEVLTFEIKLHAEFCNPEEQINALKTAKVNGTILPLLMGNGKYRGDYVIISNPYTIDQALSDGTVVRATVNLTIKEYISYNKLEQKQLNQRKAAFAVGNKNPVVRVNPQPDDTTKSIARNITGTKQQVNQVNNLVNDYQNNVSNRPVIAKKIIDSCKQAQQNLSDLNDQLESARETYNTFTAIKGAAASAVTAVKGISSLFPFTSPTDLLTANSYLQSSVGTLGSVSLPLIQLVATRQPIS